MGTTYRIAEVAERSGFSPATLRYYEGLGLLRPGRSEAGYRQYDDRTLQRLRFIARAKQLGCSLDEIAELSTLWDAGQCTHVQQRLQAAVEVKVATSQRQVADLMMFTAELQRAAAALAASPATGACDDTCACLTEPESPPASGRGPAATAPAPVALLARPDAPQGDACGPDGACACGSDGAGAGEEPAIACSLDVASMGTRVEEWAAALAGVVARHPVDGGVRLELGPGTDIGEVARLAAAEQDCCRFFRFTLSIDARGAALEARAPADAIDVVTALFGAPT